ncbi:hypothetical protein AVEN_48398-1 [Araneus ventricosus]|uniref:Uncharacterized protein n=1 Tax=Araneus ventricosus TaxID=182803 RepID=A0A4Y2NV52_ARAVE|nr:hypothetical protein AVEN_48398-1 [Araneus ventricosus]
MSLNLANHGLRTTAPGECSRPVGTNRSTSFQFSVHLFRLVIHGGSMHTTQPVTLVLLGYCVYPSSRFQNCTAPLSRQSFTPPAPFCGFRYCERASLPLPHDRISVLLPSAPNRKRDWMKIQPSRPQCVNSHRILALTAGFGPFHSIWSGALALLSFMV